MTEENLSERVTIKMTRLMRRELEQLAGQENRSTGSMIRQLIGAALRQRKARKAAI